MYKDLTLSWNYNQQPLIVASSTKCETVLSMYVYWMLKLNLSYKKILSKSNRRDDISLPVAYVT